MGRPVRPTKLCLDECLGVPIPPINDPLHEMQHPLVELAQTIPPDNGKRMRKLNDRLWWRGRRSDRRVLVTELTAGELARRELPDEMSWWMGYAGLRRDVYEPLELRAERAARETPQKVCTDFLLPGRWDTDRLIAEMALISNRALRQFLIDGIARSMRDGNTYECETEDFVISVLVRADSGGEAYLAVGSVGFHFNTDALAIALGMIPGIRAEDWQPEPSPIAEITPLPGQIVFSTLLSPRVQAAILEAASDEAE